MFFTIALIFLALFTFAPSVSSAQNFVPSHYYIGFNGNRTIYMSTGVGGIGKANSNPTLLQNMTNSSASNSCNFSPMIFKIHYLSR